MLQREVLVKWSSTNENIDGDFGASTYFIAFCEKQQLSNLLCSCVIERVDDDVENTTRTLPPHCLGTLTAVRLTKYSISKELTW